MKIHCQLHNLIWDHLITYSHGILSIDKLYSYEDYIDEDNPDKGVYVIIYTYRYLQPSNIFELPLQALALGFIRTLNKLLNIQALSYKEYLYTFTNSKIKVLNGTVGIYLKYSRSPQEPQEPFTVGF
jgi:hypothetical protein